MKKKKKDLHRQQGQQGLLDPIKPAYNQSRTDGRLKLTASAFNSTMDQYAGIPAHSTYWYTQLATGFYGAGKDNRGRCTDNLSGRHPI